ncbi:MAG: type VI secretion system baseplate subunit TssF [Chlamydiales bacterium]
MSIEEKLYQAYLEEVQQIEKFRTSHAATLYGDTPINSEDPYTKRLIEALAFYGARARLQGVQKVNTIHQNLFRQYFPYLVHALPAVAMLQLKPTIRYPEKVVLPAGSELIFRTANQLKATFQTLDEVTVFPFFLKNFEFGRRSEGGWQCSIEFTSTHISTDEVGFMRIYINHLNSFFASLSVSFAIQYSLERVQVFYDDERMKSAKGRDCSVQCGYQSQERRVFTHVIEQIRSLLHFPQQELFVNIAIPPLEARWKSFTLVFEFNEKWPESCRLNSESFIPFVVPIINLKKAYSEPIVDDGTKDSYPVLYPEPLYKFELHTVTNVSEILAVGTKPIAPGLLGIGGEGSYEVDYFQKEIELDLPNAFLDPKTVSIEALWTQPWFSNYVNEELDLLFTDAQTLGINVRLLGSIYRYENRLEEDPNFLIRILSLKNQSRLTCNEILFIMNVMKDLSNSYFDAVPGLILELRVNEKFNPKQMNMLVEYEFFLKDLGNQKWELVLLFFKYLNDLLNCWLAIFEVETKVHFQKIKRPFIFRRGANHELSVLARDFFFS